MQVVEMIKEKALADKVKKLMGTGVNEYDAVRQAIEEHSKVLISKAEALKKKVNGNV